MNLGHHANFPLTYIMPSSDKKKKIVFKKEHIQRQKRIKDRVQKPFNYTVEQEKSPN